MHGNARRVVSNLAFHVSEADLTVRAGIEVQR